jgi:hypothetical protein
MNKHSPLKQFDHLVKLANCGADAIAQTSHNTYISVCFGKQNCFRKQFQLASSLLLITLCAYLHHLQIILTYKPRTQEKLAKFGYRPNMK